ncbi:MAG: carboxymuconolactone decarboxylase family protein [Tagaea sp.]
MNLETLKAALPDYARDLKLNLSSLAAETALDDATRAMVFVASALAVRQDTVRDTVVGEFAPGLAPEALQAAKIANAIMCMNNVYYRFTHLVSAPDYATMQAKLRMNAMAKPGVDKAPFELMSIAVSAINGCGMCMDSHEKVLRQHGVEPAAIQAAVRIAATLHAIAATLDAEAGVRTLAQAA